MDDLLAFIRACLDTEEQAARRLPDDYRAYVCDDGCIEQSEEQWADGSDRLPNHHNSWLPMYDSRTRLADIEAKRLLIDDLIATPHFLHDGEWYGCQAVTVGTGDGPDLPTGRPCTCGRDEDVERRIKILAQPCAGREGWREEWTA